MSEYSVGPEFGEGTYKKVYKTSKTHGQSVFKVAHSKKLNDKYKNKFLIITFKNSSPEKIYEELKLYYEFSKLGISPKVWYVSWVDNEGLIQLSLKYFLANWPTGFPRNINLLMEKVDCGRNIFDHYVGDHDYERFFEDLRNFITEKIVGNGYVNTDIKPENLCIDPDTGDMLMIDLDPNFLKRTNPAIPGNPAIPNYPASLNDIYVDYMLFQVFVVMVRTRKNVKFEKFFTQKRIINVLRELIVNIHNPNGHPLRSLIHYSEVNRDFYGIVSNYHRLNKIYLGYIFLEQLLKDILNKIGIVSVPQDVEEPTASLSEDNPPNNNPPNNNVQNYNPPTYSPERRGLGNWFPRGGNKSKGNKSKGNKSKGNKKKKNSRTRKTRKAHK